MNVHLPKKDITMLIRVLVFIFLVNACAPSLNVKKEKPIPMPSTFSDNLIPAKQSSADMAWEKVFKDEVLIGYINEAMEKNQELRILEQDIAIANNEVLARSGEYLPKVGVEGATGVEKAERFGQEGANDSLHYGRAAAVMSWEIDIWKKLRNATKAAYYEYLASIEGRRFMVTRLVAEISGNYFELMANDNELRIIENYIEILEKVKTMAQAQLKAGRASSLAVKRFEGEVLKNQARKYKIQQKIVMAQNRLNRLLGRYPQEVERKSKDFQNYSLAKIKASIPANLLDNRPDVRRANYELESRKLSVSAAKARFYPSLTIDAEAGYEKFNAKHFLTPVTALYGVAAGLTMPLLNRRAIKAEYFTASNRQVSAVYHYEQTMIKAFAEVVNLLAKVKNYTAMYDLKSKQVKALNEAFEVSTLLFRSARVDYIEALLTQRDALDAQLELVETKKQQLTAVVDLYKALGGGWRAQDESDIPKSNY
jgi:NodT family efflux transporter outer membrane factor (OMF) lipoprotein